MKKLAIITALILFAGISFGQSLKSGSIVAVHHYKIVLQPDVTFNQFMEFMENTYKPSFEKAFPGTEIIGLWGDRGELKNTFAGVVIFDSMETRDKYFPVEDEGGENWTEEQQKTWQNIRDGIGKLTLDFATIYTDWKVL